jgi:sugar O-acyltransferase (sialic acid O-acetyltransferase NeuD family)
LDTASLAHFYLKHDTDHEVVAFSVNEQYMPPDQSFEGLPVIPFEEVVHVFSPDDYHFLVPMTGRNMNRLREAMYNEVKIKGYRLISYVSSKATVFPGAEIGENCFILEDNTLQPFTAIGNNVVMWSGNHIGHHGVIKDHVFFTSHVVLSGHCVVDPYCLFGVNSTIRDKTHVAEGTFVAMGACVTRNTEPWGVYTGVPARKRKVPSYELSSF